MVNEKNLLLSAQFIPPLIHRSYAISNQNRFQRCYINSFIIVYLKGLIRNSDEKPVIHLIQKRGALSSEDANAFNSANIVRSWKRKVQMFFRIVE